MPEIYPAKIQITRPMNQQGAKTIRVDIERATGHYVVETEIPEGEVVRMLLGSFQVPCTVTDYTAEVATHLERERWATEIAEKIKQLDALGLPEVAHAAAAIRDLEQRLDRIADNQIATIRGIADRRLHRPASTLPQPVIGPGSPVGHRYGRFVVEQETEPGCYLIREDVGPDGTGGGRTFLLCEDENEAKTARIFPCDTHGLVMGGTQRVEASVQAMLAWLGSRPVEGPTRVLERPAAKPFDPTAFPEGWTRRDSGTYAYKYGKHLTVDYFPRGGKADIMRWVQRPHGEEYEWDTEEPEGSDLVQAGRALEALGKHLERVQAEAMNKAHGWEEKR